MADNIGRSHSATPYYFGVDAMRFLAALMVAAFHFTMHKTGLSGVAPFGWVGVEIFFLISGFVIVNSANGTSPIQFAKARLLRLYPAAWVCAVLGAATFLLAGEGRIRTAAMAARSFFLYFRGPWLSAAYWTLPVEMSFYAGIFILLSQGLFEHLEAIAAVLAVISVVYTCALSGYWAGLLPFEWIDFANGPGNMLLLRHGQFFSLGIFLWLHSRGRLTTLGRVAAIPAFIGAIMEIGCRSAEYAPSFAEPIPFQSLFIYTTVMWLLAGALIFLSVRFARGINGVDPRLLRVLRILGLTTYPFYLLHEVIGVSAVEALQRKGVSFEIAAVLGLTSTLIASLFVSVGTEPWLRGQFSRILNQIDRRYLFSRPIFKSLYQPGGSV